MIWSRRHCSQLSSVLSGVPVRLNFALVEGGLASRQDLFRCEQESLRAQAELTQANGVEIASHYALRVVSGSPASHSADNAPARAGGGGEY